MVSRKLEFILESETLDHALCMNTEDPKYDDFKNTFGERIIVFNKKDLTAEVIVETIFNVANTK